MDDSVIEGQERHYSKEETRTFRAPNVASLLNAWILVEERMFCSERQQLGHCPRITELISSLHTYKAVDGGEDKTVGGATEPGCAVHGSPWHL